MNSDAISVPTHNVRAKTALHAGAREDSMSPSAATCTLMMASRLLLVLDPVIATPSDPGREQEDEP